MQKITLGNKRLVQQVMLAGVGVLSIVLALGYGASLFAADTPTVSSVSPAMGSVEGGNTVTISGSNFFLGATPATKVSAGAIHSCGVYDGAAYCWGQNNHGQLGNGGSTDSNTLVAVNTTGVLANKTIVDIAAGGSHTVAIDSDGDVYTWGYNNNGQLGDGTRDPQTLPVAISTSGLLSGKTIVAIDAGGSYSVAVDSDGKVYAWGYNGSGQLGDNSTTQRTSPVEVYSSGALSGKSIIDISASNSETTMAVDSEGQVYGWGYNYHGQIGNNSTTQSLQPVATDITGVLADKKIQQVESGDSYTIALDDEGTAYAWGWKRGGRLGEGSDSNSGQITPVEVDMTGVLAGKKLKEISTGTQHTIALDENGRVYAWGDGNNGQLGNGVTGVATTPVEVSVDGVLGGKKVIGVTAGSGHSIVFDENGYVYAWGSNGAGQLGDGTLEVSYIPVSVEGIMSYPPRVTVGSEEATSVQYNSDTSLTATVPAQPAGVYDLTVTNPDDQSATLVSAYEYLAPPEIISVSPSSGARTGGDTVTITGTGFREEVTVSFGGTEATSVTWVSTTTLLATVPAGDVGVVDVIVTDNEDQSATLEDAFTYTELPPTIVSVAPNKGPEDGGQEVTIEGSGFTKGRSEFSYVTTGMYHTCGISDGKAYCWGWNNVGQLGNNSNVNSPVPVPVSTEGTPLEGKYVEALALGDNHTLALASDGTVYAWGEGRGGELGNNVSSISWTPVAVQTVGTPMEGKEIIDIAAGEINNSYAVADDGSVYAWGSNYSGQLGIGTTIGPSTCEVSLAGNASCSGVPVMVTGVLIGELIVDISAGPNYIHALGSDGGVYGWGKNDHGQVGDGTTLDRISPVEITTKGSLSGRVIIKLVSGQHTPQALDDTGKIHGWGYGGYFSLGLNTAVDHPLPLEISAYGDLQGVTITDLTIWSGRDASGSFYVWGANRQGQFGIGSTMMWSPPINIGLPSGLPGNPSHISSSYFGSCAIYSGDVYCWGQNSYGRVGDGTTTDDRLVATPVQPIYESVPDISFGGTSAYIKSMTDTAITIITPEHATGLVDVTITNYDSQSFTLNDAYEYIGGPEITSLSLGTGSIAGGDAVTVLGENFTENTTFSIGDNQVLEATYISPTQYLILIPASAVPGVVDVTVSDEYDQVDILESGYTYRLPAPSIDSVMSTYSTMEGGIQATITGSGFVAKTDGGSWYEVMFGNVSATDVTYVDSTTLTVTVPSHAVGVVDVTIGGEYSDPVQLTNAFTYLPVSYSFESSPLSIASGEAGEVTIQARDSEGGEIISPIDIVLDLTSSSANGFFSHSLDEPDWNKTSVTIPAGSSTATFYYRDTQTNEPTITITDKANTSASQAQYVGPKYKLLVTGVTDPVSAGLPSSITVQAIDADGNPQADYLGTIEFSGTDSSSLLPDSYTFKAGDFGSHTFVNAVMMMTPGEHCVTATDVTYSTITGSQCDISVSSASEGTASRLAIITPPQSFPLDDSSSAITVQTQDSANLPAAPLLDTTIYLYTSSTTGEFSLTGTDGWVSGGDFPIVIRSGTTAANVFYRDTSAGDYILTARDDEDQGTGEDYGWTNATQSVTVGVGAPSQFVMTSLGQAVAGEWVPVAISLEDTDDNSVTAPRNIPIQLTSNSATAQFSVDEMGSDVHTELDVLLSTGSKSVTVYVRDTINHQLILQASDLSPPEAGEISSASLIMDVDTAQAYRVGFMPVDSTLVHSAASLAAFLQDEFGNTIVVDEPVEVVFTADSSTGAFSLGGVDPWTETISRNIQIGASATAVYYRDTTVGTWTVNASSGTLLSGSTSVQVEPLSYTPLNGSLRFNIAPDTYTAGLSQQVEVGLYDRYGNPATSNQNVTIVFTADKGQYSADDTSWQTSLSRVIPAGEHSATVYYQSTNSGDAVQSAYYQGFLEDTQIKKTITVEAIEPSQYEFASAPQAVAKGTSSEAFVLRLLDEFGNESSAVNTIDVSLSSTSESGTFQVEEDGSWENDGTLTIPSGVSEVHFYYSDTDIGEPTISVDTDTFETLSHSIKVIEDFVAKSTLTASAQAKVGEITPVTLTTYSSSDIEVGVIEDVSFALDNSGDGEFSLTSDPWVPVSTVVLQEDESSKTIYYRSIELGVDTVSAAESPSQGWEDALHTFTVGSGNFYQLDFTNVPGVIPVTETSLPFVVSAKDMYGNVTSVENDTTVYLYTDSLTGEFDETGSGDWSTDQVEIAIGGTSATFYYRDMTLGASVNLIASDQQPLDSEDQGIINAVTTVNITGQAPDQIEFVSSEQTVQAGEHSDLITVQLQKEDGSAAVQGNGAILELDGATFYSAEDNTSEITEVQVPYGASTVSFYASSYQAGEIVLTASYGSLSGSQSLMVEAGAPHHLAFTTAEQLRQAGAPSAQMTVELQDEFDNTVDATSDMDLTLSSSCGDGSFSLTTDSWSPVESVTINSGFSSATFFYRGTIAGSCDLVVSADGLESAEQSHVIQAADVSRLVVSSIPEGIIAGETVQLRANFVDQYGNIATWTSPSSKVFYLDTSSPTGEFSPSNEIVVGGQDIPETGVSFEYRDTTVGEATITVRDQQAATDTDWIDASIPLEVKPGTPSKLAFAPNPLTFSAGTLQQVRVEVHNQYGAAISTESDITAYVFSDDADGVFKANDNPASSNITSTVISANETGAYVYYTQTQAGGVELRASVVSSGEPQGDDLADGTISATVLPGDIGGAEFTTPEQSLMANQPSEEIIVQPLDIYGNITTFASSTELYLGSTSDTGTFFASVNSSPGSVVTSVTALAGSDAVSFHYRDTTPGVHTISTSDQPDGAPVGNLLGATQSVIVSAGDPARLTIEGQTGVLERGEISAPFTITLKNIYHNTTISDEDITVTLLGDMGEFALSPSGPWDVSQLTIPAGESQASFYYRNTQQIEDVLIQVAEINDSLSGASRTITIQPGAFAQLDFLSAPQSFSAKHPSGPMNVAALNAYGYETTVSEPTRLYLRSTISSGEFGSQSSTWGNNFVMIEPSDDNRSVATFYYRDGQVGTPTLTVTTALEGDGIHVEQQQTITEQVHTDFRVVNISDPQYQGSPSSVVVSAIDAGGYVIDNYAGTVSFSSDDPDAILPSSYTFDPESDKGIHTFTNAVAFTTPGEKTVTVTDGSDITGAQTDITVVGAPVVTLARVAVVEPTGSLITPISQVSEVITLQLQDSTGTPFVAPIGGYALRLSVDSSSGEFAISQSGPWQQEMTVTVPAGLSYINVYYRDSTAGQFTITAADWQDDTDDPGIENATLEAIIQEIEVEDDITVRSQNFAGQMVVNPYLYSSLADGSIRGEVDVLLSARERANGDALAGDWTITFRSSQDTLATRTFPSSLAASYQSGLLNAKAGDGPYFIDGQVAVDQRQSTIAIEVPVSPWRAQVQVSATVDGAVVAAETFRNDQRTNTDVLTLRFIDESGTEVAGSLVSLPGAQGQNGLYERTMRIQDEAGQLRVLARLLDGQGYILAESLSAPFTQYTPGDTQPPVEGEVPVGDSDDQSSEESTDTPALPVDSTQEPPAASEEEKSPQDSRNQQSVGVAGSIESMVSFVREVVHQVLTHPATPYVFPVVLFVVIIAIVLAVVVQIYAMIKRIHSLRLLLAKEAKTAKDKSEFLTIAAHYLRTPIAILEGAADLLRQSRFQAEVGIIRQSVQNLRTKAEAILTETSSQESMQSIEQPKANAIGSRLYASPLFWLPIAASIAATLLLNWALNAAGTDVSMAAYVEQLLLLALAAFLLYMALYQRLVRREHEKLLARVMKQRSQLDEAKNEFIKKTYDTLSVDTVGLIGAKNRLPQEDKSVELLSDGSRRLLSLLAKFETLAKIDSLKINPSVFDSEQLVALSMEAFEQSAADKEISLKSQVPHISLRQDGQLLTSVLRSVIDNAIKFSPRRSKVVVTARKLKNEMVFMVADSGEGFEQDPNELIGMFERGEAAESVEHEGMGLSLYLNKIILENLGGSLSIKNGAKQGARVAVRVPINAA